MKYATNRASIFQSFLLPPDRISGVFPLFINLVHQQYIPSYRLCHTCERKTFDIFPPKKLVRYMKVDHHLCKPESSEVHVLHIPKFDFVVRQFDY